MFFSKPSAVLLLTSQELEFWVIGQPKAFRFSLPAPAVSHMEVTDLSAFQTALTKVLEPLQLPTQNFVMVLSPELVFQKQYALGVAKPVSAQPAPVKAVASKATGKAEKAAAEKVVEVVAETVEAEAPEVKAPTVEELEIKFRALLPFNAYDVLVTSVVTNEMVSCAAAPRSLIRGVVEALKQLNWSVKGVYPLSAFAEVKTPLSMDKAEQIVNQLGEAKATNFLQDTSEPVEEKSEKVVEVSEESSDEPSSSSKMPQWVLLLIALVLFALCGGLIWWNQQRNLANTKQQTAVTPTPAVTAAPVATDSALLEPNAKIKTELTISLLNGSGVAGQAGVLRSALVRAGYVARNITAANAASSAAKTTVVFGPAVGKAARDEIASVLKTQLGADPVVEATTSATRDVVVVTGE